MTAYRVILASASPARLQTLRSAGLTPEVMVSGVDEDKVAEPTVAELVATLARLKAQAVAERLSAEVGSTTVVIGCDSLLELDGVGLGKPGTAIEATRRWQSMRGRSGVLHTGHHVVRIESGELAAESASAATIVHFAELSDAEITAYVATGEPLDVAGAFTIDGLGGAFVTRIEGDHHSVVGLSLPLVRSMLATLGISWTDLWA